MLQRFCNVFATYLQRICNGAPSGTERHRTAPNHQEPRIKPFAASCNSVQSAANGLLCKSATRVRPISALTEGREDACDQQAQQSDWTWKEIRIRTQSNGRPLQPIPGTDSGNPLFQMPGRVRYLLPSETVPETTHEADLSPGRLVTMRISCEMRVLVPSPLNSTLIKCTFFSPTGTLN